MEQVVVWCFKGNNLSKERVRATDQELIRTQDRFKFSFQKLAVGLKRELSS